MMADTGRRPNGADRSLRTSRYERLCVAVTSAILLLGAVTFLMLLAWLTSSVRWSQPPSAVALHENSPHEASDAPGGETFNELQPPGQDELPATVQSLTMPAFESIPSVVQSQSVTLEAIREIEADRQRSGERAGGTGPRASGILGANAGGFERWEIRFSSNSLEEYKRQLDFFGIELGIAGGGVNTVDYVKGFSTGSPIIRLAQDPKQEKRIRFLYRGGPLKEADHHLARAAGFNVEGRVVFQFYTDEMYRSLLVLENERMKPRFISDVVRTVFGVRPAGSGFEFYVIRQDYRHVVSPPPRTVTMR